MREYFLFVALIVTAALLFGVIATTGFMIDTVAGGGSNFVGNGSRKAVDEQLINPCGLFVTGINV